MFVPEDIHDVDEKLQEEHVTEPHEFAVPLRYLRDMLLYHTSYLCVC
jgi:hypothetical protein